MTLTEKQTIELLKLAYTPLELLKHFNDIDVEHLASSGKFSVMEARIFPFQRYHIYVDRQLMDTIDIIEKPQCREFIKQLF